MAAGALPGPKGPPAGAVFRCAFFIPHDSNRLGRGSPAGVQERSGCQQTAGLQGHNGPEQSVVHYVSSLAAYYFLRKAHFAHGGKFMNNVQLIGRLTNDVDLKYTANNKAVATVTLAVNRTYKNQNGEREADFINLVLWGKVAENFSNWIKKGYLVAVTGAIRTRNYENQQGYRVYVTEVLVGAFQNLQPRDASNSGNGDYGHTSNGFAGSGFETLEISDDDLPF